VTIRSRRRDLAGPATTSLLTTVQQLETVGRMTHRLVTSTDGVRLAVHESGDPDRPVLVAVHGYPDNHHVWDGVASELGRDFRVVAYDVRGAGDSDKPAGRAAYRIAQLGDDFAAVIDAVSPDAPVHVLAHDWGSMQLWEPLSDARVADRVATFTSISGPSVAMAGAWFRRRGHLGATLRQLVSSTYMVMFQVPWLPEQVLRRAPIERVAGDAFARSEADKVNGINLYRANVVGRVLRPRPRRLRLPVLVIAPVDDPYSRLVTATESPVPHVEDLTVEAVPGGHWVVAEDPALVADRVRAFITARSAERIGR
jgi:pimeloyl-ACP methyl ester carboxylesterase